MTTMMTMPFQLVLMNGNPRILTIFRSIIFFFFKFLQHNIDIVCICIGKRLKFKSKSHCYVYDLKGQKVRRKITKIKKRKKDFKIQPRQQDKTRFFPALNQKKKKKHNNKNQTDSNKAIKQKNNKKNIQYKTDALRSQ